MSTILMSIMPQYAQRIFEGRKKYEFRKSKPQKKVERMIIYATKPQKEIIGEAEIDSILEGTPDEIWKITQQESGITEEFFYKYYQGCEKAYAYELKNVLKYRTPQKLSAYGLKRAPQSYMYIVEQ